MIAIEVGMRRQIPTLSTYFFSLFNDGLRHCAFAKKNRFSTRLVHKLTNRSIDSHTT